MRRGDVDGDGRFDASDLRGLVGYVQQGDASPPCLAAGDFDDDGEITVHDTLMAARTLHGEEAIASAPSLIFAYQRGVHPLPCRTDCP